MLNLIDSFIRSEFARKEIKPNMWLSVIDFADRAGLETLRDHANDVFYESFEWQELQTDAWERKREREENDEDDGRGGRTFKGKHHRR